MALPNYQTYLALGKPMFETGWGEAGPVRPFRSGASAMAVALIA